MHKQHPQTAYRKYAILIGTIFENCDRGWFCGAIRFFLALIAFSLFSLDDAPPME
jgi:hypothetical protein